MYFRGPFCPQKGPWNTTACFTPARTHVICNPGSAHMSHVTPGPRMSKQACKDIVRPMCFKAPKQVKRALRPLDMS